MNVSEARLIATWCPLIASAPNQPANTEIDAKVVNSTMDWIPIGSPMTRVRPSAALWSVSRRHGARTPASSRRESTNRRPSMNQRLIVLESADPGAPIAGAPRCPNTNTQLRVRFEMFPAMIVITMARVCFIACRLWRSVTHSSSTIMLGADIHTNPAARGTTSGGWRSSRKTLSAGRHSSVTTAPISTARTTPRWTPSAIPSWSRAPAAWETMGSIAHRVPMPNTARPKT